MYMTLCRDFGRHKHPCLFFYFRKPFEGRAAYSLEAAGLGTGLPHSGAENFYSGSRERTGGCHYLCFVLGATGAGYDEGRLLEIVAKEGF